MGDDDDSMASSSAGVARISAVECQLLMPHPPDDPEDPLKPSPPQHVGVRHETLTSMLRNWISKKFMSGCVILLPIAITFYITWWFIQFVDGFFSPIYTHLGINTFGLGFLTSILFIFSVGVFFSSWVGANILLVGEWVIKKMPLVRHIYSASKQISTAISPDQNTQAFKEVAIIRHPRVGEYAFGFITSSLKLQVWLKDFVLILVWSVPMQGLLMTRIFPDASHTILFTPLAMMITVFIVSSLCIQHHTGAEELCTVYVPTNHLYIGDIILLNSKDIIRPNLSVREGIEIVVSGGMTMPQHIYPLQL